MSIDQLALDLSSKLGNKLNKNEEEVQIIKYGLFIVLHTTVSILLTAIVGILTGMLIEIMLISITASLLKRYSGGIHASTPFRCTLLGLILGIFLTIICKIMLNSFNIYNLILFSVSSLAIVSFILYKKCPVGNVNKPLKKENIRKRLRKKTFNFMILVSILILILLVIYINTEIYTIKVMLLSVELGLVLQVFGITNIGARFIECIELIFDNIKIK